jgi:organic radical activating enzyme
MNDSFCILPWIHAATTASGTLRLCCNGLNDANQLTKNNGSKHKIWKKDELSEYFKSDSINQIRNEMLGSIKPNSCLRCYQQEDLGSFSPRNSFNQEFKHLYNVNDLNSTIPIIKYLDLRLGNLCNLKCTMCNPYASNQWIEEWKILYPNNNLSETINNYEWYNDNNFWNNLEKVLPDLEEIYLTGGEPTIVPAHERLLNLCVQKGYSKNITLKYNTNVTNIQTWLIEKWQEFKKIKLNLSIDGFDVVNNYIRFPSKWKIIDRNLKFLDSMNSDNYTMTIHTTVQATNIGNLIPLFDYMQDFKKIKNFPYLNILDGPKYLNIKILPEEYKKQIEKDLLDWCNTSKDFDQLKIERIQLVIRYMNEADWSYLLPEFFNKQQQLDKIRKQDLFEVFPEFKTIKDSIKE